MRQASHRIGLNAKLGYVPWALACLWSALARYNA